MSAPSTGPTSIVSGSTRRACPVGTRCRSASSSCSTWRRRANEHLGARAPPTREPVVSARSYLSIGDVLTLLRQEFPDVTISKIRFLESQGLVNPERTPSGYRKFYEHDVERLRWVLRQQREHFLPLKVIKDRLDEDANGTDLSTAASEPAAVADDAPTATAEVRHVAEPVLV